MVKLGFIGFGEAGFNIANGLKAEGLDGIIAYDKYWDIQPGATLICERAKEAEIELLPSLQALVENSEIVISAVSADMAVSLAKAAQPFLRPETLYVDINATSPMTKEKVDSIIAGSALFVDCAVMGPVPNNRHKVPMSVSGKGAHRFVETMLPYGMNITLMDGLAGSSSASKMFRSIFMKGFVMLILEMLLAADKYQVADDVLKSVEKTLTSGPLLETINGLVGRGVIHSQRREHEMEEVIATLDSLNVDGLMSKATKEKLGWCTSLGLKEYFNGIPPEDFHEIFIALKETGTST